MTRATIAVAADPAPCLALRRAVFIDEQGFPEDEDDHDADAVHLLAREGGRAVGAARIVFEHDTARIGRVCVLPEARGGGLGTALIEAALGIARQRPGTRAARLSAQVRATAFYAKLGFEPEGPPHDDFGVPHRMMVRAL